MRGPSHVVFGLAGAVVVDSALHLAGTPLIGGPFPPAPDQIALKIIYYGFAGFGALVPDIDNARSTIGKRAGFVSKGLQHLAGHRTIFHSLLGLALVGMLIWVAQYALGIALYQLGLRQAGTQLGITGSGGTLALGMGVAFSGLLVGYFLHLVADSLTEGGVPWLWPSHVRYGFPPDRKMRFRSGSPTEPVVVVAVSLLVIIGLYAHVLVI